MLIPLNVLSVDLILSLIEVTKSLHSQQYYHTILYVRHGDVGFPFEGTMDLYEDKLPATLQPHLEVPIFIMKGNYAFNLWQNYNSELLTIMSLQGNELKDKDLLNILWLTLKRNRKARLLLIAGDSASEEYLSTILKFCTDNKSVNVIAVKLSSMGTKTVYQPNIFPIYSMKSFKLRQVPEFELYRNHLKNMQGFPFRAAVTKTSTRAYVLNQMNGNIVLGGFVGHLITEFVQKHNATLSIPRYDGMHASLFHMNLTEFVQKFDISPEPYVYNDKSEIEFTHCFTYVSSCLMAPMGKPMPAYRFYAYLLQDIIAIVLISFIFASILGLVHKIEGEIFCWKNRLFNVYVFNGLLGQSFRMESTFYGLRSFLYLLIALEGIIFNTSFVTQLQKFKTCQPTEKPIQTLDELRMSGMKYVTFPEEYNLFTKFDSFGPYRPFVHMLNTSREFSTLRYNMDTSYLYPTTPQTWAVYNMQQQFFKKPRFIYTNMCFITKQGLPLFLPVDSPYTEAMNAIIDMAVQAGLVEFWTGLTFLEGLRLNRFPLRDLSEDSHYEPMKLQDLQSVFNVFFSMLCVVLLCFSGEIFWAKRHLLWLRLRSRYVAQGSNH